MIYLPKSAVENKQMALWVCERIPDCAFIDGYYQSIGFLVDGKPAAVVVCHDYRPPNIVMSVAADDPRWASRSHLYLLFSYVFGELKCERITAFINKKNRRSRRLVEWIGFNYEGNMRQAAPGADLIVYGLLKKDFQCQYLAKAGRRLHKAQRPKT